ncbi:unnamed protein product, partial [Mesorhabditis spiculigera]
MLSNAMLTCCTALTSAMPYDTGLSTAALAFRTAPPYATPLYGKPPPQIPRYLEPRGSYESMPLLPQPIPEPYPLGIRERSLLSREVPPLPPRDYDREYLIEPRLVPAYRPTYVYGPPEYAYAPIREKHHFSPLKGFLKGTLEGIVLGSTFGLIGT